MAKGQLTSTLPQALGVFYDRQFLEWERQLLRLEQFAQKRPLPGNSGKTIYFSGYRPFDLVTSPLTEGSNPTADSFEARQISATVQEWGKTAKMSKLLELTKLDSGLMEQTNLMAENAAQSMDYQMTRELMRGAGIWAAVPVAAATNTKLHTLVSSASNSTSRFVTSAHQFGSWAGGVATLVKDGNVLSGKTIKYGYAGRISAYTSRAAGRDVFQLRTSASLGNRAAPEAFASGDQVRVVTAAGLTAASILSTTAVRFAQRDLLNNFAKPFEGGYFFAVTSPTTSADLKADTLWQNANSYSGIRQLKLGEIGEWFGFRFVDTTIPGRESVAGAEDRTGGAVYHNFFLGRNAFGHSELANAGDIMNIVRGPDSYNPLNRYTLVGWEQTYAVRQLTAPHIVSVLTGATA